MTRRSALVSVPLTSSGVTRRVQRAISRDFDHRFSSMEELGGALMAAAHAAGVSLPAKFDELFPPYRETELPNAPRTSRTSTGPMNPADMKLGTDPTMLPAAVAIIRGVDASWLRESSVVDELVRPPHEDLFR